VSELVIETTALHKAFWTRRGGRQVAVDSLDLAVPRGGVHGFLGPNGSGKTTTIRMLLGLASADAGHMQLFGQRVPRDLPAVLGRIGAVVEQPKFFAGFSGRRNLTLLAGSVGIGAARVDEVIEEVGLTGREQDRFKGYSLGMKQRLAIAATLLKRPDLLILDEPTNGLDPAGIRDIRNTIRQLGRSGVTVLLSSHILAEVQQVCDSVTIIGHGRKLASGPVHEVIGANSTTSVRVRLGDLDRGHAKLLDAGLHVRRENDHLLVDETDDPARITRILAESGLYVAELTPLAADLETVFLTLTGDDDAAEAAR
jgi:ABC-2 type transport system ATP-binding protein